MYYDCNVNDESTHDVSPSQYYHAANANPYGVPLFAYARNVLNPDWDTNVLVCELLLKSSLVLHVMSLYIHLLMFCLSYAN